MKRIIVFILSFILGINYRVRRKNPWILKEKTMNARRNSLFFSANLRLWEKYLSKKGSWIGYNSNFKNVPIFPHGINGIFVSGSAQIGSNAVIFQQVTIGSNTITGSKNFGAPIIGDSCYIGAGAKIIGGINIGNNCRIGANCVVTMNIPDNTTVVMNKPVLITRDFPLDNRYRTFDGQKWVVLGSD